MPCAQQDERLSRINAAGPITVTRRATHFAVCAHDSGGRPVAWAKIPFHLATRKGLEDHHGDNDVGVDIGRTEHCWWLGRWESPFVVPSSDGERLLDWMTQSTEPFRGLNRDGFYRQLGVRRGIWCRFDNERIVCEEHARANFALVGKKMDARWIHGPASIPVLGLR